MTDDGAADRYEEDGGNDLFGDIFLGSIEAFDGSDVVSTNGGVDILTAGNGNDLLDGWGGGRSPDR